MNSEDHDVLIEIRADVKHLVGTVNTHLEDDKTAFTKLNEGQEFLKKVVWSCMGAGTLVALILKFIKQENNMTTIALLLVAYVLGGLTWNWALTQLQKFFKKND